VLEPEVDLAGNYDLTLRWLKFALEVNYGDFFVAGSPTSPPQIFGTTAQSS
jgi:hypothetical protein